MSGISRDDWLSALKEACEAPPPPSDALTVMEFGELIGVGRAQAYKRLQILVKSGRAELTKKQIRRGGELGHWVWVPAYRLITPEKPAKKR